MGNKSVKAANPGLLIDFEFLMQDITPMNLPRFKEFVEATDGVNHLNKKKCNLMMIYLLYTP